MGRVSGHYKQGSWVRVGTKQGRVGTKQSLVLWKVSVANVFVFQLHALSTDGSLTMCCANDPCTLLYLKKQMDEGEFSALPV